METFLCVAMQIFDNILKYLSYIQPIYEIKSCTNPFPPKKRIYPSSYLVVIEFVSKKVSCSLDFTCMANEKHFKCA